MYLCVCGIAEKSCQTGWVTLEWSWASITLRLCKKGIIKCEAASKGGKGVNVRVWGVGGVEWGKRGSDLNHHTGAKKGIGWPGKVSSWQGWSLRDDASKEHCAPPSHSLDVYDQSGKERVDADGITRALQAEGDGRENWASSRIFINSFSLFLRYLTDQTSKRIWLFPSKRESVER